MTNRGRARAPLPELEGAGRGASPPEARRARAGSGATSGSPRRSSAPSNSSREAHGGESRIKAARFPSRKTLEEFDWSFQRSVKKDLVLHLAQLDFLLWKENVVLLGPPGTGKTHVAIALGIRACLAGHRVAFATATEWVARLLERPAPRAALGRAAAPGAHAARHRRRGRLCATRRRESVWA